MRIMCMKTEFLMIVNVVIMNMMKLRGLIVKQLYIYLNQGNAYLNNMLRIGLPLDTGIIRPKMMNNNTSYNIDIEKYVQNNVGEVN